MSEYNGVIVPLAWPDALVGSSYPKMDPFWKVLNVCRDSFYKVGHAAMLLVNLDDGEVQYFDFGRYIAPEGHGRIRSQETDPEIKLKLRAEVTEGKIQNLKQILLEISQNPHTHGSGTLYAGEYYGFDFQEVLNHIHEKQEYVLQEYGPFVIGGTNCSRFVAQTIAQFSKWKTRVKFLYPWYATPSPLGNIYNCPSETMFAISDGVVEEIDIEKFATRFKILRKKVFFTKEDPPVPPKEKALSGNFKVGDKPENVSDNAIWLGGLGAGAWHDVVEVFNDRIKVKRVQSSGHVDFEEDFYHDPLSGIFQHEKPFKVVHGTTYKAVIVHQEDRKLVFNRSEE
jgi:hypothetical protein